MLFIYIVSKTKTITFRRASNKTMSKFVAEELTLLDNSVARMNADSNFTVGTSAFNEASNASNANLDEAILEDGEVLTVPEEDELDKFVFTQSINGNKAYGILCMSSTGVPKKLYSNTLKKRVIKYDPTTLQPVREGGVVKPIQSNSELSNKVRACALIGDIFKLIAGKKIVFKKIGDFTTAKRDRDNNVTGTRQTSVFEPSFAA